MVELPTGGKCVPLHRWHPRTFQSKVLTCHWKQTRDRARGRLVLLCPRTVCHCDTELSKPISLELSYHWSSIPPSPAIAQIPQIRTMICVLQWPSPAFIPCRYSSAHFLPHGLFFVNSHLTQSFCFYVSSCLWSTTAWKYQIKLPEMSYPYVFNCIPFTSSLMTSQTVCSIPPGYESPVQSVHNVCMTCPVVAQSCQWLGIVGFYSNDKLFTNGPVL